MSTVTSNSDNHHYSSLLWPVDLYHQTEILMIQINSAVTTRYPYGIFTTLHKTNPYI